jgi:hypothetical protein
VYRADIPFFVPFISWSFRMITYSLSGVGRGMEGYDALDCTMISRGSSGARLGRYIKLCILPDKAALFLFEFHADEYKSGIENKSGFEWN